MNVSGLKRKRAVSGIPGKLLCAKAGIDRSRLSHIERGYITPSKREMAKLQGALDELITSKQKVAAMAAKVGWPVEGL